MCIRERKPAVPDYGSFMTACSKDAKEVVTRTFANKNCTGSVVKTTLVRRPANKCIVNDPVYPDVVTTRLPRILACDTKNEGVVMQQYEANPKGMTLQCVKRADREIFFRANTCVPCNTEDCRRP